MTLETQSKFLLEKKEFISSAIRDLKVLIERNEAESKNSVSHPISQKDFLNNLETLLFPLVDKLLINTQALLERLKIQNLTKASDFFAIVVKKYEKQIHKCSAFFDEIKSVLAIFHQNKIWTAEEDKRLFACLSKLQSLHGKEAIFKSEIFTPKENVRIFDIARCFDLEKSLEITVPFKEILQHLFQTVQTKITYISKKTDFTVANSQIFQLNSSLILYKVSVNICYLYAVLPGIPYEKNSLGKIGKNGLKPLANCVFRLTVKDGHIIEIKRLKTSLSIKIEHFAETCVFTGGRDCKNILNTYSRWYSKDLHSKLPSFFLVEKKNFVDGNLSTHKIIAPYFPGEDLNAVIQQGLLKNVFIQSFVLNALYDLFEKFIQRFYQCSEDFSGHQGHDLKLQNIIVSQLHLDYFKSTKKYTQKDLFDKALPYPSKPALELIDFGESPGTDVFLPQKKLNAQAVDLYAAVICFVCVFFNISTTELGGLWKNERPAALVPPALLFELASFCSCQGIKTHFSERTQKQFLIIFNQALEDIYSLNLQDVLFKLRDFIRSLSVNQEVSPLITLCDTLRDFNKALDKKIKENSSDNDILYSLWTSITNFLFSLEGYLDLPSAANHNDDLQLKQSTYLNDLGSGYQTLISEIEKARKIIISSEDKSWSFLFSKPLSDFEKQFLELEKNLKTETLLKLVHKNGIFSPLILP